MRKSSYAVAAWTLLLIGLIGAMTLAPGCRKKPVPVQPAKVEPPPPPPPPPPPAPTITLSADPSTITAGQSATLKWTSTNATSVSIDGGIGNVEASGSKEVSPGSSITYTATATGPGGRSSASSRITVTEPPPTPPPKPNITDEEFFNSRVKDIFFDFDKYDIREDARQTLTEDARALQERSHLRVTIEGHCDERGSEKYNLALGDRRANAAKEFLTNQGIPADRMDTVSYGEERPFALGHDEESWAQNRRAHFVKKP